MSSTKTVSFRLPMDEYIKYLQKATTMNLGPADYALLKIYTEEKTNDEIERLKASIAALESEYEDFKTKSSESQANEVASVRMELKEFYEGELKAKREEFSTLHNRVQELIKQLQKVSIENEVLNTKVIELENELHKTKEAAKQKMQTGNETVAKQLEKKQTEIQDLQIRLRLQEQECKEIKEENKKQTVVTNESIKRAKIESEKELDAVKAEYEQKAMKVITEIVKSDIFSGKVEIAKWEKRFREI
jgi:chromosome segregation ATPase